mgnify:CR=1 FL=1
MRYMATETLTLRLCADGYYRTDWYDDKGVKRSKSFGKAKIVNNEIQIPGNELVVPWSGIKFAAGGDDMGQNTMGKGLIGQYQKKADGKIELEIVYPFDVATANMTYPFPRF